MKFPYLFILLSCLFKNSVSHKKHHSNQCTRQEQVKQEEAHLIGIAILHRHGDRAPVFTFPTDEYPCTDPKIWPEGLGQLTDVGKKRIFRIGQFFRQTYNLSRDMTIYCRSSPTDRCLVSAELLLAAAFPPDRLLRDRNEMGSISCSFCYT